MTTCPKCDVLRKALSKLAGASYAVYNEDDVFTVREEGDGRVERDKALREAIDNAARALGIPPEDL